MKRIFQLGCLIVAPLFSVAAAEHDAFLKAESLARQTTTTVKQYETLYQQLNDHPLQPYVKLARLKANLNWRNRDVISQFLDEYQGTPLDWPLRSAWLDFLVKQKKAEQYLKDYRTTSNPEYRCHRLRFELQLNRRALPAMVDEIKTIWLSPDSLPKACDPLFTLWQQAGLLDNELRWQRITLAVTNKGQSQLVKFLAKSLPKDQQQLADFWLTIRANPKKLNSKTLPGKGPKAREVALYGLRRLAWQDRDAALAAWPLFAERFHWTTAELEELTYQFALALANGKHKEAKSWLDQVPVNRYDESFIHWRLADAIHNQDWALLLTLTNQLPVTWLQEHMVAYWHARALAQTGKIEQAEQEFKQLAKVRHYYGYLAAARLKLPPQLQDQPGLANTDHRTFITQHPAWRRAEALYQLERWRDARREWLYLLEQLPKPELKLAAVELASALGWHDRGIFALADSPYRDDVKRRFPIAYWSDISKYSKRAKVDPSWALAITRRESSFMADAVSHANAYGLMQILPETARFIRRKAVSRDHLLDANHNIDIGTRYLKYLQDKYDGNYVLATAAFNAGWFNVDKWIDSQPVPLDVWIETLPFKETRNYVKAILAYQQVYRLQLGDSESVFSPLIGMTIKR